MSAPMTQPLHGSYLMPSLEHATVADAMHPGIISCDGDTPLTEVARLMASNHVHCVAVSGVPHEYATIWGIVYDLDVVASGIRGSTEQTAAALARTPVVHVEPSVALRAAAELMLTHKVSHLLVVDPTAQRPLGILSTLDITGILAWGEA